jgi:hypothetical protein
MKRYKIHNILWEYEILVENDIVIESTVSINNLKHWTIGVTLEFLKEYYDNSYFGNNIMRTVIQEIKH